MWRADDIMIKENKEIWLKTLCDILEKRIKDNSFWDFESIIDVIIDEFLVDNKKKDIREFIKWKTSEQLQEYFKKISSLFY
jgi:hypothetical protein